MFPSDVLILGIPNDIIGPIIGAMVGFGIGAVGTFLWRNYKRTKINEQKIERYGRTLFGDEMNDQYEGVTTQLNDISDRIQELEKSVDKMERCLNRHIDKDNSTTDSDQ